MTLRKKMEAMQKDLSDQYTSAIALLRRVESLEKHLGVAYLEAPVIPPGGHYKLCKKCSHVPAKYTKRGIAYISPYTVVCQCPCHKDKPTKGKRA